jgi:choline kinase
VKAIILSAGQGSRLHPHTAVRPKCMIEVDGERSILEVQLETLADCGVEEAVVVVGFGAEHVEAFLRDRPVPGIRTRTIFNPFYRTSDNLMTCWLVREELKDEFILLNGDTVFEHGVLDALLDSTPAPITLTINEKSEYDDDDMKISLGDSLRLSRVSKQLVNDIHGESIGLISFRGEGPAIFRASLERAAREPGALTSYYLSVIDRVAASVCVETVAITGLWWQEVDTPEDLLAIRESLNPSEDDFHVSPRYPVERPALQLVR